jgi:hypothetical protein
VQASKVHAAAPAGQEYDVLSELCFETNASAASGHSLCRRKMAVTVVVKGVVAFVSFAKPLLSIPESLDLCSFWCD